VAALGALFSGQVKVPKENIVGRLNNAYAVFNTMMVPERLGNGGYDNRSPRPALENSYKVFNSKESFWEDDKRVPRRKFSDR